MLFTHPPAVRPRHLPAHGCGCADPIAFGHDACFIKADSIVIPPALVTVHKHCRCRECPCDCHALKIPA